MIHITYPIVVLVRHNSSRATQHITTVVAVGPFLSEEQEIIFEVGFERQKIVPGGNHIQLHNSWGCSAKTVHKIRESNPQVNLFCWNRRILFHRVWLWALASGGCEKRGTLLSLNCRIRCYQDHRGRVYQLPCREQCHLRQDCWDNDEESTFQLRRLGKVDPTMLIILPTEPKATGPMWNMFCSQMRRRKGGKGDLYICTGKPFFQSYGGIAAYHNNIVDNNRFQSDIWQSQSFAVQGGFVPSSCFVNPTVLCNVQNLR